MTTIHLTLRAALAAAGLLALAGAVQSRRAAAQIRDVIASHPSTTAYMHRRGDRAGDVGVEHGPWVPIAAVPASLVCAVVKSEDRRFFRHRGFDGAQLWRAATGTVTGTRRMGGSTISQQLARNLFLGDERTLRRKLAEAVYTVGVELGADKTTLLETYLNVIEWGPRVWGLHAAARHYFDTAPESLSLAQSVFLASIIPDPAHARQDDPRVQRVERRVLYQLGVSRIATPAAVQDAADSLGLEPVASRRVADAPPARATLGIADAGDCGLDLELARETRSAAGDDPPASRGAGLPDGGRADGPLVLRVTRPMLPVADDQPVTVLGSAGNGAARVMVDDVPVTVSPSGAFAVAVPAAAAHRVVATLAGRSAERGLAVTHAVARPASPRAIAVSRHVTMARDLFTDILAPSGAHARVYLLAGSEVDVDSTRGDSLHVAPEGASALWLAADATGAPRATTPALPASPGTRAVSVALARRPGVVVVRERRDGLLVRVIRAGSSATPLVMGTSPAVRVVASRRGDDLELHVSDADGFLGYDLSVEPGRLRLSLRNAPHGDRPLRVLVDPGHPPLGTTGALGTRESDVTLALARHLVEELGRTGIVATLTRADDAPRTLAQRVDVARSTAPDLVISLHADATPDGDDPRRGTGPRTYYLHAAAAPLAVAVQRALVRDLHLHDRGVPRRSLALTDVGSSAAILCEVASLSSPEEEALLVQPAFQAAVARAIASGVREFAARVKTPTAGSAAR